MSKLLLILPIVAITLLIVFKAKVGNLLPVVLPPSSPLTQKLSSLSKPAIPTPQGLVADAKTGLNIPAGYSVNTVANIPGARDLQLTPAGTLLVSAPSQGKVFALKNGQPQAILSNLRRPHGLAFYQNQLFVAEEQSLSRYNWNEDTQTATLDKKLFDLPTGQRHFSRTLAFNNSGNLFVSLGSSCDVCFEAQPWLAAVIITDKDGNNPRVYSKGLRNAVFLTLGPNNQIWATEMGRDFLGDNLPPDEINVLKEGGDYGWPLCYGNRVYDQKFGKGSPSDCSSTLPPAFELPAHNAPLGLKFIDSPEFPTAWQGDLLVALHGSWNSSVPVGYKVVRLNVDGGRVLDSSDFITGFLRGSQVAARPVDLEFGSAGQLFLSDDKAGNIYSLTKN